MTDLLAPLFLATLGRFLAAELTFLYVSLKTPTNELVLAGKIRSFWFCSQNGFVSKLGR